MDRWDLLEAFVHIADTGSLSRAAKALRLTQPAISKRLDRLERQVRTRLVERGTRGVRLTDAGAKYLDVVKRLRAELDETETSLSVARAGLSGTLRLSLPTSLGQCWLMRLIVDFQKQHPHVEIEATLTDAVTDFVSDATDVAVRVGPVRSPNVVARQLGTYGYTLVGTPKYFEKAGIPKTLEELQTRPYYRWAFDSEEFVLPSGELIRFTPPQVLRLTNSAAIMNVVLCDAGIGRLPRYVTQEAIDRGELIEVLSEFEIPRSMVSAVYLPSRFVTERTRRFVSFLVEHTPRIPGWRAP
jgi:DNA-binding transcriptional LysR family regulator